MIRISEKLVNRENSQTAELSEMLSKSRHNGRILPFCEFWELSGSLIIPWSCRQNYVLPSFVRTAKFASSLPIPNYSWICPLISYKKIGMGGRERERQRGFWFEDIVTALMKFCVCDISLVSFLLGGHVLLSLKLRGWIRWVLGPFYFQLPRFLLLLFERERERERRWGLTILPRLVSNS